MEGRGLLLPDESVEEAEQLRENGVEMAGLARDFWR